MLEASINMTRRIGIEIECLAIDIGGSDANTYRQRLADIFTRNGLPAVARPYSHAPVPSGALFCIEYDSSLVPDHRGYQGITFHNLEIKTKPLDGFAEFTSVMPRALELMRFANFQVNRSCGLHCHLDTSAEVADNPRFIRSLLNLTWRFEPLIYGLCPPSRRDCGYAQPMPDLRDEWSRCRNHRSYARLLGNFTRYCGLNMTHCLSGNSRIEARWAGGSLDYAKISHWVIFLNRLLDAANIRNAQTPRQQVENSRHGLQKMFVTLGLLGNTRVWKVSKDLAPTRKYLLKRWRSLNCPLGKSSRRPALAAASSNDDAGG